MQFAHHVLAAILFLCSLNKAAATSPEEQQVSSKFGYRFHDIERKPGATKKAPNLHSCTDLCSETPGCKSSNYNLLDGDCELNRNEHSKYKNNLVEDERFVYFMNPNPKTEPQKTVLKYKTCAKLKAMDSSLPSGNYELEVSGTTKSVYCDMDNFGGGWSLVVSISGSNSEHILRTENKCFNHTQCVPLATGTLVARKLSDAHIRVLASYEGTFRIDVTSTTTTDYTGFFRLSQGSQVFDSGCAGIGCPRIIASHVYPYVWESNCNGVEKGYQTPTSRNCYRVFDNHDNKECGSVWYSSGYSSKRVLYSYCGHNGIHSGLQGNMYVR